MRKKTSDPLWTQRIILGLLALLLLIIGLGRILKGEANFVNWWHALVFAPFAIAIGVLAVLAPRNFWVPGQPTLNTRSGTRLSVVRIGKTRWAE